MDQPSVTHAQFVIERTYPAPPARVFDAFADPAKKQRWFAAGAVEHHLDFQPGGRERTRSLMGANTPFPGTPLTNESVYLDIQPASRVVMAYTMSVGDRRISASLATIEFLAAGETGTKLIFTEQGSYFPGSDGPELREAGWSQILDRLAGFQP
jgi:uncharacterized protein YndB with AHSA1/START domain